MAAIAADLKLMAQGRGVANYRYDTLDASATIDASGYFNNADDALNLRVGDMIDHVQWTTTTYTGTVADVGLHIVLSVSAAGVVDLSNDLLGATLVDSD